MLPKGILFDLDDTIIAIGAVAGPVWRGVCEEYAGECDLFTADSLYETTNKVRRWYWSDAERHKVGRNDLDNTRRMIVELAFEKLNLTDMVLARQIADSYTEEREKAIHLLPKAEETLEELAAREVSLALITNGETHKQRGKIERFGLERFFKVILVEGELGYGKPEPEVFSRALNDLSLSPEEVWSVGDNLEWDVAGPQKLGIFSIWNDYRGSGLAASEQVVPDRIINNISELIE
jgi:putative hydrolase of the HAD superfamily